MNKPEILAPGGSVGSVCAAVNAGCDAVYIGGRRFGARAFADNPDTCELLELMDEVHMRGKKMYLTVNTVLTEGEFTPLYEYIRQVYEHGLDAVIVQDAGVMKFIHDEFPEIAIHASTQMSILRKEAVSLLEKYGVTRIVPARELTLEEINSIDKASDIEIEVFVHGALCCSMSGQCLMSSLIGGRSGNRGACAQPCRKEYRYNKGKKECFLSLKDLCALPYIPELVESGVDSFKIEGRMKKPEYVALSTYMYRKYRDIYYECGYDEYKNVIINSKEFKKDYTALMDIYNRGGFTKGYLFDRKVTDDIFTGDRANHTGVKVGTVGAKGILNINEQVYSHDVLEIRDNSGNTVHEHTLKDGLESGRIKIKAGYNSEKIKTGYDVYRIRNNELIARINETAGSSMPPVIVSGKFTANKHEKMKLTMSAADNDSMVMVEGSACEAASKHPARAEDVKKKIMVSGETSFVWDKLEIEIEDDLFLSAGELKDIRRLAMGELQKKLKESFRRNTIMCTKSPADTNNIMSAEKATDEIIAECRTIEQLSLVVEESCVDTVYVCIEDMDDAAVKQLKDMLLSTGKHVYIAMPRVARMDILEHFDRQYDIENLLLNYESVRGIVVYSVDELAYYKAVINNWHTEKNIKIRSGDNLYVRNTRAYECLKEMGVSHMSLSVEMSDRELEAFKGAHADVLLYGRISAMIMLNHYGAEGVLEDGYRNKYEIISHTNTGYTELLNYEIRNYIDKSDIYRGLSKRIRFVNEGGNKVRSVLKGIHREDKFT